MSDSHAGYRTIHVISDADKAKAKAEKDAKAAKAAEREKLRSDVANQAIKALEILAATEKSLYSSGVGKRALVELDHKAGTVEVKPVDKERLWYLIHNAVPEWDDEKLIALVARYIMQHRSFEGFRPLEAIIPTPAFISGFKFVGGAPGYDSHTGYFYCQPKELADHCFQEHATPEDAKRAYQHLLELFSDFPIPDDSERANLIAILLTIVCRDALNCLVPSLAIVGNIPSAGKSLLCESLCRIALNEELAPFSPPSTDHKWEVRLDALVIRSKRIACLDNIEGYFHKHYLASFVTSKVRATLSGLEVPNRVTFLLNGNNLTLSRDMTERVIWCKLWSADPGKRRDNFKIKDLDQYLQEHWADYFDDLVTIVFAWLNAGRPELGRDTVMNKYSHWERTIGGMLELCGVTDFLASQLSNAEEADLEQREMIQFIESVIERFPEVLETGVPIGRIAELMVPGGAWHQTLSGVHGRNADNVAKSLGKFLRDRFGRDFGGWKMSKVRDTAANLLVICKA